MQHRPGLIRLAAILIGYGLFVIISASWGWPDADTDPTRWLVGIGVGVAAGVSIHYIGTRHLPRSSAAPAPRRERFRPMVASEPAPFKDGIEIALKNNRFKFLQATSEEDLSEWAQRLASETGIVMRIPTFFTFGVGYPATGGVSHGDHGAVDINFSFHGGLKIYQHFELKPSKEAEQRLLRRKAGQVVTIQGRPGKFYQAGELRHIPANSLMWWDGKVLLTVWSVSLDRELLMQTAEGLKSVVSE
jgi:hypothetical protein